MTHAKANTMGWSTAGGAAKAETITSAILKSRTVDRSSKVSQDRFWHCEIVFGRAEIVFGLAEIIFGLAEIDFSLRDCCWIR